MGGGANLLSQLSQEGNEGEINPLSLGLATLSAGMTDPGAANYLQSLKTPAGATKDMYLDKVVSAPELTGLQRFKNQALDLGISGVDKLQGLQSAVADKGILSMEGAKLASIPATQGAMDLGIAETRRFNKQQIIDDALSALEEGADSASRALAIRQSMEAYGFTEDEIVDTISAAGYRAGGRVGLKGGGMDAGQMYITEPGIMGNPAVMEKIENMREFMIANPDIEDITDYSEKYESKDPDFEGIKGAVESVDENLRVDRAGDFFRLRDEAIQKGDSDKIKEIESDFFREFGMVMPKMAKDGGLMNLGGKEMDLRKGGFVPIGKKERADDVPARLSKNEFVMTADAVRAAGGGSVNEGAKRMYDVMNKLEARA